MKKPLIGVNCNIKFYEGVSGTLNLEQLYVEAIYQAGGIPQIIPYIKDVNAIDEMISLYDGLLMTGGGGVAPSIEKLDVLPSLEEQNPIRHPHDLGLIKAALTKKIPIMGLCRGHQTINEALGGTIENISDTSHLQKKAANEALHSIKIEPESILKGCINIEVINVNSLHRQRVMELGNGLKVSAYAEDGTIEAIEGVDYPFILGLQFHPEFMLEVPQMLSIYQAFVKAAYQFKFGCLD